MRVYSRCKNKNCNNEVHTSTNSYTRVEFAMNEGEEKDIICKKCSKSFKYHVDELYANKSKFVFIISLSIFIIGTPLIFLFILPILNRYGNPHLIIEIASLLFIPVFAYIILMKQDQTRVSNFNRRKLKGRIHNI